MRAYLLLCGSLLPCIAAPAAAQGRPVVERIEPTSGAPGTEVQLIGRALAPGSRILLGEVEVEVLRRLPNRWTVRIPEGAASGSLVIAVGDATYRGPHFRVTEGRPPPEIEGLSPDEGPPGSEVTLHGQGFSAGLADNSVSLGDRPVVVRAATPTSIRVIVPADGRTGPFRVSVARAGVVESPPFTVTEGTSIAEVEPTVGPPGTEVTLRGRGFATEPADNRVYIGNRPAPIVRARPTELVIQIPEGATTGPLMVDVRGKGRAEGRQPFTVQDPPVVQALSPAAAPPGEVVRIVGNHFGTDARAVRLSLSGRPLFVRSVRPQVIEAIVPPGASTGKVAVTVHGLGPAESPQPLEVRERVTIREVSPRSGPAGTNVTLRGEGFGTSAEAVTVTIGNARATVVRTSPRELVVRIPGAASGPLTVRVQGGGEARTSAPFLVTQPPFVAGFSPAAGPAGTAVTLRGRNFGTTAALVRVTLAGRELQVRSVTDEQIVAVVPDGAVTGTLAVSVRLQGRDSADTAFEVREAVAAPEGDAPRAE